MTRIQITLDKCYSCDCDPGEFNWTTQEDHDTEIAELLNVELEDGKRRAEQKQKDWERYSIEVSEKELAELQAQRSAYLRAQSNFNAFCNTLKTRQTTPDRERY